MFKSKKYIPWWNLKLGEKSFQSLVFAFKKRFISNGPLSLSFQKDLEIFLNVKHATLTTSGSTSLLLALKILGIKEGDEVIVPDRTFQATAHAAYFLGAKVQCAEVDAVRGLITAKTIKPLISSKTKAIVVVHLNGRAVDMDSVMKLARQNKIPVVEDVAQAFGSVYKGKKLGSIGDIGCFSFGVTKFLTMGQGGAVVTNNSAFHSVIQDYLFQGQSGEDDKKFDSAGLNFRMSNLLVSIGIPQLKIFETNKKKYLRVFNLYQKLLKSVPEVKFITTDMPSEVPVWAEVLVEERDKLYEYLKKNQIESVKFYPSIRKAKYLKIATGYYPCSDQFEKNGLILPSGLNLSEKSIKRIADAIKKFYQGK